MEFKPVARLKCRQQHALPARWAVPVVFWLLELFTSKLFGIGMDLETDLELDGGETGRGRDDIGKGGIPALIHARAFDMLQLLGHPSREATSWRSEFASGVVVGESTCILGAWR